MPSPNPSREREGDQAERTWRSIDFTPPRRALFLHHLAEQGNVRAAASRVGISPSSAYLARRRDAVFRAGWDAALVHSREHALQVLACQALDGVREEMWHRGELVGHRVRHDARLLLAHLGRLDARCEGDEAAQARAERFDEMLALVAGERFDIALRDQADGVIRPEWDEILPITRERHGERAAALAESELRWGVGCDYDDKEEEPAAEEPGPVESAGLVARAVAEAEWDGWGYRVAAVNHALDAGEEPVIAGEPVPEDQADEAPYEVKSAGGIAPRLRRRKGGWLTSAGGVGGGAGKGADFFARTPCGPSTCSVGAAPGGV